MPKRVEVCAFPQGKRMAVTTSFDDGHTFDRRIITAFNDWGLKGTFNLNSGLLGRIGKPLPDGNRVYLDASEVASLYQGHEVAVHGVTHAWLNRLDTTQIAREVLEDRIALEDLVGYPVRGMAYAYGAYDLKIIKILRALGITYSRTCETSEDCFPPKEPLAWPTTAHQFAANPSIPERFEKRYYSPKASGVFAVWGHGFEFEERNDWNALERIYKPLSGKPDIWYCSNIELFDYEEARQRLIVAANRCTVTNPSGRPVTIAVDGKLTDVPAATTLRLDK
jgi:peptidoglycan-N-acetylglucosamine deacetylase